jgi:hypothetical protein
MRHPTADSSWFTFETPAVSGFFELNPKTLLNCLFHVKVLQQLTIFPAR